MDRRGARGFFFWLLRLANGTAAVLACSWILLVSLGVVGEETADGLIIVQPFATPIAIGCFAIVFFNILAVVSVLRGTREPEEQYLLTKNPDGQARVAISAIRDALQRTVDDFPGVDSARVGVHRVSNRKVLVQTNFRTAHGASVVQVTEAMRQALRQRFDEIVQLDDNETAVFEFNLEGFLSESDAPGRPVPPPEPPPESENRATFTGPKYPIEETEGV